jgi:uncharacterized membrane protein YjdF
MLERIKNSSKYSHAKRLSFDLFVLLFVFALIYYVGGHYVPVEAKIGFISLFLSKWIFISGGIIAAHISRIMLFPYIDFSNKETEPIMKIFLICWYSVIIAMFARGG